jgi:hypothetical protein
MNLLYIIFDTDCIENTSSHVLLEALFIVQLPSNNLQRCIHYCCPHSRLRECLPSRYLVTTTFLYCCAFQHAYRAIAWQRFGQILYNILFSSSIIISISLHDSGRFRRLLFRAVGYTKRDVSYSPWWTRLLSPHSPCRTRIRTRTCTTHPLYFYATCREARHCYVLAYSTP